MLYDNQVLFTLQEITQTWHIKEKDILYTILIVTPLIKLIKKDLSNVNNTSETESWFKHIKKELNNLKKSQKVIIKRCLREHWE